jgi:hypothetical protein
MKTRCDLCGKELILSPTGHQWCADYTCKNGMGVPFSNKTGFTSTSRSGHWPRVRCRNPTNNRLATVAAGLTAQFFLDEGAAIASHDVVL